MNCQSRRSYFLSNQTQIWFAKVEGHIYHLIKHKYDLEKEEGLIYYLIKHKYKLLKLKVKLIIQLNTNKVEGHIYYLIRCTSSNTLLNYTNM